MAIKIKFDNQHNVIPPTFILSHRNGDRIGTIPARNIIIKDPMNSNTELIFYVNKSEDGVKYRDWNKLCDFKLMYCREWDMWFEIYVEIDESNTPRKNVSAKSLGEAELSQIKLFNIEINTEVDISRDDYQITKLYDEKNPKASLLHRISEKIPHYRFAHVDSSIKNIQRTFSFNNTSIYDAFQDIASEVDCIFIIECGCTPEGKIDRKISVYDLESYCYDCGYRGNFSDKCPKCESETISSGYGEDTTIFVSVENLADEITYTTDHGSVKNCFKLEAGDDLMTATIANCNPNGTPYIWYISDEQKADMSEELVKRLDEYDAGYNELYNDSVISLNSQAVSEYNSLVRKYSAYTDAYSLIDAEMAGYSALMQAYYDVIDFALYLRSGLMPTVTMSDTTAQIECSKLTATKLSPTAVQNLSNCSLYTADNAVLGMAKVIVDSRYKVSVIGSSFSSGVWYGSFKLENYSDEEDTFTGEPIAIVISEDYETYVRQRMSRVLDSDSDGTNDIVSLFEMDNSLFYIELKKYGLIPLQTIRGAAQSCLDIMIEQGISDSNNWSKDIADLYNAMYIPYYEKMQIVDNEIALRESEIAIISGKYDENGKIVTYGIRNLIEERRDAIQAELNFEEFLGEDLWLEFIAYRREDTYSNDNYISDGLDNAEIFKNAREFLEVANKEIIKSATMQHTISASLYNLLAMKEFAAITSYFELGNWIRVSIDGKVYKLRLIQYEVDFDNFDKISVEFSDVKCTADGMSDIEDILSQAYSMATSYSSVVRQVGQNKKTKGKLDDWVNDGLSLTSMKIINNADNQNVTWDSHGILCREYVPMYGDYDDEQLKIINKGLYVTDDNWRTSRAGIGKFTFYNPKSGLMETKFGVIADTLVGNLMLTKEIGIYNENGSVSIDENGLVITTASVESGDAISFTIQKKETNEFGEIQYIPQFYIDDDGNVNINGTLNIMSSNNKKVSLSEIINNVSSLSDTIDEMNANKNLTGDGITVGSEGSPYKTVLSSEGLFFYKDDDILRSFTSTEFAIQFVDVQTRLGIGDHYVIAPRTDGSFSIAWVD